jgi:hypothetical protein
MSMSDWIRTSGVLWLLFAGTVQAQTPSQESWGTLRGRVVFEGEVPAPEPLEIERDKEICGTFGLVDESLLVNPKNRGVRNTFVWLDVRERPAIHPELQALSAEPVSLDNADCRFEPRAQVLRAGQTLLLKNSDPVSHNAAVYVKRNTPFNVILPLTNPVEKSFSKPETLPVRVDCSIHAWMRGWLLIVDHPYAAVTDEDGRFEIPQLPAGEHRFRLWHERPGGLSAATANGESLKLDKGVVLLTIPAEGELDLGDVAVPASAWVPPAKK